MSRPLAWTALQAGITSAAHIPHPGPAKKEKERGIERERERERESEREREGGSTRKTTPSHETGEIETVDLRLYSARYSSKTHNWELQTPVVAFHSHTEQEHVCYIHILFFKVLLATVLFP